VGFLALEQVQELSGSLIEKIKYVKINKE